MDRNMQAVVSDAIASDRLCPILLGSVGTAGGTVRMWTGLGDLTWNGDVYTGGGDLVSVGAIEEKHDSQVSAQGTVFSLSGVNPDDLSIALSEIRQGLPGKLWFAVLDGDSGVLVGEPVQIFSGLTDVPTIDDGGDTITISLSIENRLIDLERARVRRYTPEDQKAVYPDDKGFDYVAGLQEAEVSWGTGL